MYDGVTATNLPVNAQLVGGYVDGLYKWSNADWARFPNSVKVRIAVFRTTDDGHVLDVEPGNATPAESVDWVLMRRQAGVDPTVYMNSSTWSTVRSAFQARGVPEPHYWVAQYDGVASIPAGAVAKQYENDQTAGWDLSAVADHWPGVDPTPQGAPQMEQTDQLVGYRAPGGRSVGNALVDLLNFRDWWYLPMAPVEQDGLNPPPSGSRADVLYQTVQNINAKVAGLTPPAAAPATAPAVAPEAFDASVKAALLDPEVLKALAQAIVVELRNDTPAN